MQQAGLRLVPGRECGDCVACCQKLEIVDPLLHKPADVLCEHCTGQGCSIYYTRPSACRDWFCLWRVDGNLPDVMRPDKCGVVFSFETHNPPRTIFENFYVIGRSMNNDPSAFDAQPVATFLQLWTQNGAGTVPIYRSWETGVKRLMYPRGPLANAIENPGTTPHRAFVVEALAWRARYGELLRGFGFVPKF